MSLLEEPSQAGSLQHCSLLQTARQKGERTCFLQPHVDLLGPALEKEDLIFFLTPTWVPESLKSMEAILDDSIQDEDLH